MSSDELLLLEFWASPFSARVKVALQEKGISNYQTQLEDLSAKSSLLLEMNPVHKRVPVLIHNGKPVCESLIIVEYIDEIWKDKTPCLLPANPSERARLRFWANYNDETYKKYICKLWEQKEEIEEEEQKEFIKFLKLYEDELGDKPYFGGSSFGYLDIVLISNYSWFYSYEKCTKLNIEAQCPKLNEWAQRCMQRESVKMSLPDERKIYEYVLKLKEKFGTA